MAYPYEPLYEVLYYVKPLLRYSIEPTHTDCYIEIGT
jgi:hypothetical protein